MEDLYFNPTQPLIPLIKDFDSIFAAVSGVGQ